MSIICPHSCNGFRTDKNNYLKDVKLNKTILALRLTKFARTPPCTAATLLSHIERDCTVDGRCGISSILFPSRSTLYKKTHLIFTQFFIACLRLTFFSPPIAGITGIGFYLKCPILCTGSAGILHRSLTLSKSRYYQKSIGSSFEWMVVQLFGAVALISLLKVLTVHSWWAIQQTTHFPPHSICKLGSNKSEAVSGKGSCWHCTCRRKASLSCYLRWRWD